MKQVTLPSTLNIDEGDLPCIKNWEIGETYTLVVKGKLMEMKKNDPKLISMGDDDAEKIHCQIQVEKVKETDNKEVDEPEETEEEEEKEKKKNTMRKAVMSLRDKNG